MGRALSLSPPTTCSRSLSISSLPAQAPSVPLTIDINEFLQFGQLIWKSKTKKVVEGKEQRANNECSDNEDREERGVVRRENNQQRGGDEGEV